MKTSRILVVENDYSIRELYREILETEGYAVESCESGIEALASLDKNQQPCLILLDMLMPVMNGSEFMAAFAKRPHTIMPVPVYLISATAHSSEVKELGCAGFLKKPFDIDVLLSIVRANCTIVKTRTKTVIGI